MAVTTTPKVAAIVTLVLAIACYGTSAPTLAPETAAAPSPGGSDCFMVIANASDCLTFVEDGSNLTKPDKGCCPEFAGLLEGNPICLCELLGKPDSIGIKIDMKQALKLPSVCGLKTPPVSTCALAGIPVSMPPSMSDGIAPGAAATSPSSRASSPGSSSDEAAANPSQNKNEASGIQASTLALVFGFSTVFVSIFF
ncbi:xylogen-like protein 11 isoform X2 [Abrus precatorius]|uniref:Xylogen-like protein 11 isoform X2 n=1 Tax=Abrus precatorius TaxID=3816 RepID=A0A8B8KSA4_ABRPR|nr:xylogen-like protein 11 isoform X2 [Abrus precatorius]